MTSRASLPPRSCRVVDVLALAVVAAGAVYAIAPLLGQGDRVFTVLHAPSGEPATLVAHDLAMGESKEFYRAQGRVFDFSASPTKGLVAVADQVMNASSEEPASSSHHRDVSENVVLRILTSTGDVMDEIPRGRSFAWSPEGHQLAYVVGDYVDLYAPLANQAAWIWDSNTRARTLIAHDVGHLAWAKFDGNLYLWKTRFGGATDVLRYNTGSSRLEPTSHRSIYFSPSGRYYYHPGGGLGLRENVYRTSDDEPLKPSKVLSSLSGFRPRGWAPDADLLLMPAGRRVASLGRSKSAVLIFDPEHDTATEVRVSELLGWGRTSSELLVRTDAGGIQRQSVESVSVR